MSQAQYLDEIQKNFQNQDYRQRSSTYLSGSVVLPHIGKPRLQHILRSKPTERTLQLANEQDGFKWTIHATNEQ